MQNQTTFDRIGLLTVVVAATAGSGCSTMNNTEKGAVGGGVFGTAAGTAIGSCHGPTAAPVRRSAAWLAPRPVALVGNDIDKDEAKKRVNHAGAQQLAAAQAASRRLTTGDIIELTKAGQSEQVIINQIRSTGSSFRLSAADLNLLKANGVSDRVIAEMQWPGSTRGVVVQQPTPVVYDSSGVIVRFGTGGYRSAETLLLWLRLRLPTLLVMLKPIT